MQNCERRFWSCWRQRWTSEWILQFYLKWIIFIENDRFFFFSNDTFEFFQTWSGRDGTVGSNSEYRKAVVRPFGKGSGNCSEHAGGYLSTRRREITRRFAKKAQCAASQVSEMIGESDLWLFVCIEFHCTSSNHDSIVWETSLLLVKRQLMDVMR